ncbi:hypothetical protein ABIA35_002434 [Catenulispora sp. MAP12-49]|uniref:cell wall-binding repeat-containing protein n=1 Tax=Catenulispora sp. MAP12-49 TaxID=3156302 RepID=UPI003511B523
MSRPRRITAIALSSISGFAGLAPIAAHAAGGGPVVIHVDDAPGVHCSDTAAGAGSVAEPFCSVGAAVATATPGSTVLVAGLTATGSVGSNENRHVVETPITPPSGTPGSPVTIAAADPGVELDPGLSNQPVFDLDGVHDVTIKGFFLAQDGESAVTGTGGARLTLTGNSIAGAVHLTGTTDATVTDNMFWTGMTVDGNATGTDIAMNVFMQYDGLRVVDAPHTEIVSNTASATDINIGGASPDPVIENNVARTLWVSGDAMTGATVDYNILNGGQYAADYNWGTTTYQNPAAFQAGTGLGTHDLDGDPKLMQGWSQTYMPAAGSPVIGSGDPHAPGVPATDFLGQPTAGATLDRGAVQDTGLGETKLTIGLVTDASTYRTRTFTAARAGDLSSTGVTYSFDFGDGHVQPASSSPTATHTYAADGDYTVTVTVKDAAGHSIQTSQGLMILPRSRPDLVMATSGMNASGYVYVEAQPPGGYQTNYVPQGWYDFDWGDGSAVYHGGSNGAAHVVGYGHTYAPGSTPTITMRYTDSAGWQWAWTYDPVHDVQSPTVGNPPSPGGWILSGGTSGGGNPGGGGGGGTGGGGGGGGTTPGGPTGTAGQPAVTRLGGSDRYTTARTVSQAQWHNGAADAVILARGDKAPDALAGVPLAAHLHGPLLLTDPKALDGATRAEIDRVLGGPASKKTIDILGGADAVSPTIEQELRKAGYTVNRIGGTDRFSTALDVAKAFGPATETIVATGLDFPDALTAGPLGAVRNAPIVLSDGTSLDAATAAFVKSHQTIDAVGGQAVKAVAAGAPGKTVHDLAGTDRFSTAQAVAAAVVATTGHTPAGVGVAYAFNFPDALTGGAYAANAGQPLLLTDATTVAPSALSSLQSWRATLTAVEIFGGTKVVSQGAEDTIAKAVGGVER